jgi:hypothetical protein
MVMLKRTGRWWNRRRIWYFVEQHKQQETADRPHNLTLLIGFLSPLLAIVAVAVSVSNVMTSRLSLTTSQRAYLVVQESPTQNPETTTLIIRNVGNTPARNVVTNVIFLPGFTGDIFNLIDFVSGLPSPSPETDIGPKEFHEQRIVNPPEKIFNGGLYVRTAFEDTFGDQHQISWCWTLSTGKIDGKCHPFERNIEPSNIAHRFWVLVANIFAPRSSEYIFATSR